MSRIRHDINRRGASGFGYFLNQLFRSRRVAVFPSFSNLLLGKILTDFWIGTVT